MQTKLITDPVRTDPLKARAVEELQGMYSSGCGEGEGEGHCTSPYRHVVRGC